ncbi:hypothetical protein MHYP_G00221410 [Metynnis hypsauchen]
MVLKESEQLCFRGVSVDEATVRFRWVPLKALSADFSTKRWTAPTSNLSFMHDRAHSQALRQPQREKAGAVGIQAENKRWILEQQHLDMTTAVPRLFRDIVDF